MSQGEPSPNQQVDVEGCQPPNLRSSIQNFVASYKDLWIFGDLSQSPKSIGLKFQAIIQLLFALSVGNDNCKDQITINSVSSVRSVVL